MLSSTLPAANVDGADVRIPGVLIIHSNQRPLPVGVLVDETVRVRVPGEFARPVHIFSEYLDEEWSFNKAHGAMEADYFHAKYHERDIRVIFAVATEALRFVVEFRDRILPGVPIVYIAPRDAVERMQLAPDIIGEKADFDPTATLRLALRLHAGTKQVVFVLGGAERDRIWEGRVRSAAARLDEGVEITYLKGMPTEEVLHRVRSLPRTAIVYTPGYFVDGAGQVRTPREVVELIARASSVPVYGAVDTYVGTGVVGGYVTSYKEHAVAASALVVRLLNGAAPSDIGPSPVTQIPMVDWRQVTRWNIDERLLPTDARIAFREPSLLEKYWLELSIAIGVVVVQAALIFALLLEMRSRRRTAAALEQSQRQINLAAKAARLSVWMWDGAKNRAVSRTRPHPAGLAGQSMPLQHVLESVHPADREILERAVERSLATGDELDIEYRTVGDGGDVRWLAVRGRAEQPDAKRLVGIALDVTERKAEELRAAQDRTALRHMTRVSMVGQLSAAIAHQLNQPLAAILGNAEAARKILGHDHVDIAELRAICDDIVSEDQRASDVIRRLSDLYKRGDMKIEQIDLNDLIRETLELVRTELLIRHIAPIVDAAAELPTLEGGYVQLQQVVLNLVLNAADAMSGIDPGERSLVIRTIASSTDVRMDVIDNGTGIDSEHVKRLFDPFWSTKSGGMGMGLAICRSIVAAHHGTISATNNPEQGATFSVRLPTRHGTAS